ncbi:hypothetical protein JMJ77_0003792 [Colletotrichum scovillei]|uniref:Uncharacterized protein n=1 Tax=Colletotrichum scovillei TaxID=1209932 RepID=A0A9P7QVP4_9PEZI|nr:hypothetical protein JMJ77_0003792 [Colletotrichum scovillei]KAG7049038.1 hypothetical protein JMJ78_0013022 [Colletotrichum scovillei]KAG7063782.1 hypothetical protein JMJ76_0006831 [Colletotrichum scovillei]
MSRVGSARRYDDLIFGACNVRHLSILSLC